MYFSENQHCELILRELKWQIQNKGLKTLNLPFFSNPADINRICLNYFNIIYEEKV